MFRFRFRHAFVVALLAATRALSAGPAGVSGPSQGGGGSVVTLAGLHAPATVLRDVDGVPHVQAVDEHDVFYMQGYVHASDRLFQLDGLRRTASGTSAELFGASALPQDVQLRTLGLRRAAELSYAATSPKVRAALQAYAAGVNAWAGSNALPVDYARLQLTRFEPWTPVDSIAIGKLFSFQLSFDFDVDLTLAYVAYQQALAASQGAAGPALADALFFGDVFRTAPFDPASTVPDANAAGPRPGHGAQASQRPAFSPSTQRLLRRWSDEWRALPLLERTRARRQLQIGSNEWAVSGDHTQDGRPLVSNDPHLSLGLPSNLYDMQLTTADGLDVTGSSFPGAPFILLGQNRHVAWGSTTTGFDVTDYYQEQLVPDPGSPSGFSSLYLGRPEPVIPIPVTFMVNLLVAGQRDRVVEAPAGDGIPAAVLVVPRHGPIVQFDAASGTALSVQWTGAGPTRELESYYLLDRARDLQEFKAGLQYFDVGLQNFAYGDIHGNIAYFSSGEVPLREDLQAGQPDGAPPWMVRNGQGGNEWLRKRRKGPTDGSGYETLDFAEMPQVVNPRAGFFVNANNDPAGVTLANEPLGRLRADGDGIYYLAAYGFDFGTRAARITELLRSKIARGRVDRDDMAAIQADVTLFDAEVLAPTLVKAFDAATKAGAPPLLRSLAQDSRVAEAVGRLRRWSFDTPTGLEGGHDGDASGTGPSASRSPRIDASVAATIYSVWRGQAIGNAVDRTLLALSVPTPPSQEAVKALRHLVDSDGIGVSTIDFFAWVPLARPAQRRDYVLLKSLQDALSLLSGPAFANAFGGSTRQSDYLWGKLHRIGLAGAFDDESIPGATPGFAPTVAGLPGLSVDGGMGTVDVGNHDVRAADDASFMFSEGPNRRYVGSLGNRPGAIMARSILPGGESGVVGNRFYANMLSRWLDNQTYPFRTDPADVLNALDSRTEYRPAP